ncbi:MAG: hypothetical protein ACI4AM_06670 [Muribaculaceae bacterium]
MDKKASVVAKTQNRTALGVLHAYAAITPGCTLDDLRAAFPNSICPDSGVKENILPLDEAVAYNKESDMSLYFVKDEEVLHLADGTAVCLCQIWTKASLDRLAAAAANFAIEVSAPDKSQQYDKAGFIATIFLPMTVTGKTQNRTALGVLHAYAAMHPACTLDDLRTAFPKSICPDSGVTDNILPLADAEAYNSLANMSLFFVKEGEPVQLADGTAVCLCQIWTKASLDRLIAAAADLDIVVNAPDKSLTYPKAGFLLTC